MLISAISWIITGFVVGLIARAIVPGRQDVGTVMTIVLGIIGAVVGGFISTLIWTQPVAGPNEVNVQTMWPGWLMAIVGGVLVVWAYAAFTGTRRTETTRF